MAGVDGGFGGVENTSQVAFHMPSANHHFISQCILKNFCYEGEKLHYFTRRRESEGVVSRNILSVFKKRHLNSFRNEEGVVNDGLEAFFADNFDNKIGSIIENIETAVSRNSKVYFSNDDHHFLVQFLYNHMKRTPDFHDPIIDDIIGSQFFHEAVEEIELEHGEVDAELKEKLLSEKNLERTISQARVMNLARQNTEILDTIAMKSVLIAIPQNSRKQFIVASKPVVRFLNEPNAKLDNEKLELWTTLTSRLAIGFQGHRNAPEIIILDDASTRKLNLALANQSTAFAGASERLIQSLAAPR